MFSFCMYCFHTRCVSITIAVFSIIFLLCASATIYLTTRLSQSYAWNLQQQPSQDDYDQNTTGGPDIDEVKGIVFWGILGMCSSAVLVGFLGLINAKYKTCCSISSYSFLTLMLSILFLGVGGILMCVTIASDKQLGQYCQNKTYDKFTVNFSRYFLGYVEDYNTATSTLINTYMCTYYCPCVPIDSSKYTNLNQNSTILSFTGQYSTFNQCYLDLVKDQKIEPLSQELLDLVKYMEDKYQCLSVCKTPQFWFFKDIREGQPQETCEDALIDQYNFSIGILSIGLLVTGIFIFLAFNTQYGLWRRRWSRDSASSTINDRSKNYKVEA